MDEIQLILQGIGDTLYEFLVLPGKVILSALVLHAPGIADLIDIYGEYGNPLQLVATSLVLWIIFAVLVWMVIRIWQDLARISGAVFRTLLYRVGQSLGNLKTALICKLREHLPRRSSVQNASLPMVEFDDLDLAVLRSMSAQGSGFALSAADLAQEFTMRPAQVQRSLDRLFHNKLLDTAIGSTDGFDNYKLTDYGAAFLATLQQREAYA